MGKTTTVEKATTREKLARAEYWSMEARNDYVPGDKRWELLSQAHDLIMRASDMEEGEARHRVMMAIQQ